MRNLSTPSKCCLKFAFEKFSNSIVDLVLGIVAKHVVSMSIFLDELNTELVLIMGPEEIKQMPNIFDIGKRVFSAVAHEDWEVFGDVGEVVDWRVYLSIILHVLILSHIVEFCQNPTSNSCMRLITNKCFIIQL